MANAKFLPEAPQRHPIAAARYKNAKTMTGTLGALYRKTREGALSDGELEVALVARCSRGRTAHPDFAVPDEDFVAHLARCGAPIDERSAEEIHAEDLYLAFACFRGDNSAVTQLVDANSPAFVRNLRGIDPSPAFADDVRQRFWDSVLVGNLSTPARLATYAGLGPLAGWLAVGVQRMALMMRRHEQAEGRARRVVGWDADGAFSDAEIGFMKERYRAQFQQATERALETLDDRERMIFRLHLVDGVTIERIGRAYGVSHSTVSRWFAAARTKVIDEIKRALSGELRLSPGEIESLTRLVVSQLDVSLSMLAPAAR